jgi:hypothetical protein
MNHKLISMVIEKGILKHWGYQLKRIPSKVLLRGDIYIPNRVNKIGGLKEIQDAKRFVQDIFYHPFVNIKHSMKRVFMDDSVKEIGEKAFEHCLQLKEVQLSKDLQTIHLSAFLGCLQLEHLELYPSIKTIDTWAFSHCPQLTMIRFHGTIAQWQAIKIGKDAFNKKVMIHTNEGVMYKQKLLSYHEITKDVEAYLASVAPSKKVKK